MTPHRNEGGLFQIVGGRAKTSAIVAVFDPARLTQGRRAAAWTKKRLAESIGVSAAAVGQYESGLIRPRPDQLESIAAHLRVPVEFFAVGRPRADLDTVDMHFRSLRSMRAYEREQALTYVEQLWEVCQALERRVLLPPVNLPTVSDDTKSEADLPTSGTSQSPASAAQTLRSHWNLGNKPVAHLVRVMESNGILVGCLPFSDSGRVDAFSTSRTTRPIVVLASDGPDVFRHRFTAAHELGHLLLHRNAQPGDIRHEREANIFAAEFLMPKQQIEPLLPRRIDFAKLVTLQKQWGVSVEALLYRGHELGTMTDASHRRARIKLSDLRAAEAIRGESVAGYPGEIPKLLSRAVEAARITIPSLAEELSWQEQHLRSLLQIEVQPARLTLVAPDE